LKRSGFELMNRLAHPMKQLLFWCAILLIEMLSMFSPFIILTIHLVMVPILMLYMQLNLKQFCLAYGITLFVLCVITGGHGIGLALLSLFFVPTVVVMGRLYKRKLMARTVIISGVVMLIGEILLVLLVGFWAGLNPIENFKSTISQSYSLLPASFHSLDQSLFNTYLDLFAQMIPFFILLFAVLYTVLTHGIVRGLLKKSASPLPGLLSIRLWKLPKSTVWYFMIVLGISFFVNSHSDPYLQMVFVNLIPLFFLLFIIQAISFMYDVAFYKRWRRGSAVLIILLIALLIIFLPFVLYVIVLLGFMDVLFPIRQSYKGDK